MINFYPGNRLEDLVVLLNKLLEFSGPNPLAGETVIVQNRGMKHWLSLELARSCGIAMNIKFKMPGEFIWDVTRLALGPGQVPETSPYSRDVMVWRVYEILGRQEIINDDLCVEPTAYWYDAQSGQGDPLKRFQLARQLADLFEQYLIYRPDWIGEWDSGTVTHWQGRVWQWLTREQPDHPRRRLQRVIEELPGIVSDDDNELPAHIFVFGINSLPPVWIDFFNEVAGVREVHFFILNPADEYWGELNTDKQAARERARWLRQGVSPGELMLDTGNPLLAGLGRQGQEFLKLLSGYPGQETPLFSSPGRDTLLHCLQDDVLQLRDARGQQQDRQDASVQVTSAHSPFREVQALHDWLLERFENEPALTPKDVLVMCPQIETYAPCIDAVFTRGRDNDDSSASQLPCSIADRRISDSDPLVMAFSEMLELPDSRFQVSRILSYLRLPAVQRRFNVDSDDVDRFEHWLSEGAVRWGLDAAHKARLLSVPDSNDRFTWEQGLKRLLLGFAQSDRETVYNDELLLPWVEGDEAPRLGNLMQLVERLQWFSRQMLQEKTPVQWQHELTGMISELFDPDEEDLRGTGVIHAAVNSLAEFAATAGYEQLLPYTVVREFLNGCFSQPEQGQHFMTGQVTFCSMVPMRSIPFRVVAILGLNHGEFPGQRQPLGFDLMDQQPARPGDRSRRGDDRYLFLEALVSARDYLYLSYQGRDVKNNQPKQPSLVLTELVDYLQQGYGYPETAVSTLPLQPFSRENFLAPHYSYDARWLRLGEGGDVQRDNLMTLPPPELPEEGVALEQLVAVFDNPPRAFAGQRLNLWFDEPGSGGCDDTEPFASSGLDRYKLQADLVAARLKGDTGDAVLDQARLRGQLPDTPVTDRELGDWQGEADAFYQQLHEAGGGAIVTDAVAYKAGDITLTADLPYCVAGEGQGRLLFWRPSACKGKDLVRLWLHHLVASLVGGTGVITEGIYRDNKQGGCSRVSLALVEDPLGELEKWLAAWTRALCEPVPYPAELGRGYFGEGKVSPADFARAWRGDYRHAGYCADPCYAWFWPQQPEWASVEPAIKDLYGSLFAHCEVENR